jgi:hypothetical protein
MRQTIGAAAPAAGRAALWLLAVALAVPRPAAAEWFGSVEAGAIYDDNLSRSELSEDVESDRGLRLFADGGRAVELEGGK